MDTDLSVWQTVDGTGNGRWDGDRTAGRLTAPARTDWFVDPADGTGVATAPLLLTEVRGDFRLRAHVRADLRTTFDAAALFVHAGERRWAKLALERSPQGADTIVTVVTRDVSDDANGVPVPTAGRTWLRISRKGEVYAFHHSDDGRRWLLDRLFTLGPVDGHRVGLSAQSPLGDGLTVEVSDVELTATTWADVRDGS